MAASVASTFKAGEVVCKCRIIWKGMACPRAGITEKLRIIYGVAAEYAKTRGESPFMNGPEHSPLHPLTGERKAALLAI